jgi:Bacterial TniB protein
VNLLGSFSATEMTNAVVSAVQRHKVQMLIIDDVHLMKTDLKRGREVLDHVKHLNTELGEHNASLVLVGAELKESTLVMDPQIRGRLKLKTFPRYGVDGIDGQRSWQRILRDLETRISPHLSSAKDGMLYRRMAGDLWDRTGGFLGPLKELVTKAALVAIADGSHKILRRHIDGVTLSESAEDRKNVRKSSRRPRSGMEKDPPAPVRARATKSSGRCLPRAI